MLNLYHEIEVYHPANTQEKCDKDQILQFMSQNPNCLLRENEVAHFSVSIWTVDRTHTKTLMAYHNIYDSWSWIGGHADGVKDLRAVALRELEEETGVRNAKLITDSIFSLETLTVNGHMRKGVYVPSHLHFNITYLAEADENENLRINDAENQAVKWLSFEEAVTAPTEPWMIEKVYKKLIEKCRSVFGQQGGYI